MIDFEDIKYIFQIPLDWYRSISKKVFGAYGTNFIRVKEGADGAMQIDVDEDSFNTAVRASGVGGGTVMSVDHVPPDNQGNVQINAIRTINGENGDSNGNFAGVVTSINGNTPDLDGNVTMDVVETVDGLAPIDGDISFGLAGDKWVKTDAQGHLTTTNDTPITIDTSQYTPVSQNVTLVTNVVWNGTTLQKRTRQLTFENGVLVTVGNETTTTIDTPTVITWA